MANCKNCGHEAHCGTSCTQQHKDGDGKDILILCCNSCSCDSDEKTTNNEDLFNCDASGIGSADIVSVVAVGVRMANITGADATARAAA